MFSSLFGFSKNEDVVHKEKVDEAIQEARIVKDFYERYWLIWFYEWTRMISMCSKKCHASSVDPNDRVGVNNCMDRCVFKYEQTKSIVERVLEEQTTEQKYKCFFHWTNIFI